MLWTGGIQVSLAVRAGGRVSHLLMGYLQMSYLQSLPRSVCMRSTDDSKNEIV